MVGCNVYDTQPERDEVRIVYGEMRDHIADTTSRPVDELPCETARNTFGNRTPSFWGHHPYKPSQAMPCHPKSTDIETQRASTSKGCDPSQHEAWRSRPSSAQSESFAVQTSHHAVPRPPKVHPPLRLAPNGRPTGCSGGTGSLEW